MLNRDPQREMPRPPKRHHHSGQGTTPLTDEGLSAFRRAYRWLNLTLVQHGVWPLLVVVFGAPAVPIAFTPLPWYWARLAAPALAAVLALAYLAQRPEGPASDVASPNSGAVSKRGHRLREQITFAIVGVTIAVALFRLARGPYVPVLKLEAFGLADVVAYQAINFGITARFVLAGTGHALPIALFGLSWGLRNLFLAAASSLSESLILAFAGGVALGLVFGAVSFGLRRWLGGSIAAMALQLLIVYLIFGFVGS